MAELIRSDARHIPLADESVQCCITSPPYWGLRSYRGGENMIGLEPTFEDHLVNLVAVFREVRRVLRKDGTVWLNYGDAYQNPSGNFRNGYQGTVASRGSASHQSGWVKPQAHGLKPKDLMLMPARVALALQADGWWVRSEIVWHKPNPMPESCTDRPTSAHEKVFLLTKSARYFYDADAVRLPSDGWHGKVMPTHAPEHSENQQSRDSRTPKDIDGRGARLGRAPGWRKNMEQPSSANLRNVWKIPTQERFRRPLRNLPRAAGRAVHPSRHERGGRLREVRRALGAGAGNIWGEHRKKLA